MTEQPTAADLQTTAVRWLDRAATALDSLPFREWDSGDLQAAAAIGQGYADLAVLARLDENRAEDRERFTAQRREDLERIAAADLVQRETEAELKAASVSAKRLADIQIGAWGEQYPHFVVAAGASAEVKSGD